MPRCFNVCRQCACYNPPIMEELKQEAGKLSINLTDTELKQFEAFYTELALWNEHHNLTAIIDKHEVIVKHFLDSLSLIPYIPAHTQSLIDIGTGAGFPGIPLKIILPIITVTLLEASAKKVAFHEHIITQLKLEKTHSLHARAEEVGHNPDHREQYDVATARAVAELRTLVEYALPLVKVGGIFIAQKNKNQDEIDAAQSAIKEMGGKIKDILSVKLSSLEERNIIVIEKVATTPSKYPRRTGVPAKKPL